MRKLTQGLAGAAVLIGALTVLARLAGFGRTVVFSQTVTAQCVGQVYNAANMIPTIVFEIVAGGALAGMVVPVLAGPAERGERDHVRRTASAMLTWVVLALTPLSVLIAVAAGPIMTLLIPGEAHGCSAADAVAVGADMLVVFAPQVVLYGLAVVLYGVLQAHRRFTAPALAPLVSSLVVMVAYLAFVPLGAGHRDDLAGLPESAELTLSVGTTLGVLSLPLTAAVAARSLRLRPRPTLRFPPGVAARVRHLAAAGLATVVAQQVATLAVIVLSWHGTPGALADYNYAWAIYLLPWAVLAVPIATSAFPTLSARAGDADRFDAIAAATTRAVLLASGLGAAVVAAVAVPAAHFLDSAEGTHPQVLARGVLAFAPGLIGYGLVAHLGRVLFACGRGRAAATATVVGWLVVPVADIALVAAVPQEWVVAAFGAGNTLGMTVAGALLLGALVRVRGRAVLNGFGRAVPAGLLGALAGGAAGYGAAAVVGTGGRLLNVGAAALAAAVAGAVFLALALMVDGRDLRAVLNRKV
ncbi:murein biosynthesis integral membrane protein MurJ [Thermomonospora curvata]|uniref:Virulence factor MVIN family protein n=1 Tax=Thermomonospora curvata (strain ATCC 19995 / DSM 43183 / JCM 3096 / KCTC 9072 / NBRC 15933 / NCIMB 10081 / Henssen B9) TaxID=471852 RepID=D1A1Q3_THECD|nr:lipid II flippase MurJ [Thermomonospora curvata]ACY97741.1 virulence factor MVIN family protein [Thermomonospora curvata DSM 43183]